LVVDYEAGPVVNLPPVVDAGEAQTIFLGANATLEGQVTDDGLPNPPGVVTSEWTKIGGSGDVTFTVASALTTTASFSASGTYTLRLTADDGELTSTDDVMITVLPPLPPDLEKLFMPRVAAD
jgi:hypothetical protein